MACCFPVKPLPPATFEIVKFCGKTFRSSAILSSDRIRMSLPPPAAYGTTKLMARAGYPEAVFFSSVEVGVATAAGVALVGAGVAPPQAAMVITREASTVSVRGRIGILPTVFDRSGGVSLYHRVMPVETEFVPA